MPKAKKSKEVEQLEDISSDDPESELIDQIEKEAEEELKPHQDNKKSKPRSAKQMEVFEKAVQKRKELGDLSRKYQDAKKIDKELKLKDKVDYIKSVEEKLKSLKAKKPDQIDRKTKDKKKKKVVQKLESSSSSEEESEEDEVIEDVVSSSSEEEEEHVSKKNKKSKKSKLKSVKKQIQETADQALLKRLNEERIKYSSQQLFNGDLRGLF